MDRFTKTLFACLIDAPLPKKHLEARDYLILLQAYDRL
jgi:hypothetical protein